MDKVLVLNSDYTPLNVTSVRKGFVLVIKGKAEVLKQDSQKLSSSVKEYVKIAYITIPIENPKNLCGHIKPINAFSP